MFRVKGYRTRFPDFTITFAVVALITFLSLGASVLFSGCGRPAITAPLLRPAAPLGSEPIARADSTGGVPDSAAPWIVSHQNLFGRLFRTTPPAPVTVFLPRGSTLANPPKKIRLGKNAQLIIVQGTSNTVRATQQHVEKKGSGQIASDSSVLDVAAPGGDIQQAMGDNSTLDQHNTPPPVAANFLQRLKHGILNLGAVALSAIGVLTTGALVVGFFALRKKTQFKNLV